jgi:hypothetical protein
LEEIEGEGGLAGEAGAKLEGKSDPMEESKVRFIWRASSALSKSDGVGPPELIEEFVDGDNVRSELEIEELENDRSELESEEFGDARSVWRVVSEVSTSDGLGLVVFCELGGLTITEDAEWFSIFSLFEISMLL